jgi:asparagine synthase (glutamine-hydrolysing)
MYGIFGIFRFSERLSGAELEWLSTAQNALRHRGPDSHRPLDLLNKRCVLGHNRLSVVDLEGGAQPLANQDGTVWVVRCSARSLRVLRLDLE